jgi:hypothetical protein
VQTRKRDILADYIDGPNRLGDVIVGLSEAALDLPPSDGGWTIRQIVHHIADGDDIWKGFIKRAVGGLDGEFSLEWYWQIPQDEWAEHWAYAQRAIAPSLALLRANRHHVVQLLEHIPGAWEKHLCIRWPNGEEQEISVGWVVEMQTRHVEGHIEDIRKIRETHRI